MNIVLTNKTIWINKKCRRIILSSSLRNLKVNIILEIIENNTPTQMNHLKKQFNLMLIHHTGKSQDALKIAAAQEI